MEPTHVAERLAAEVVERYVFPEVGLQVAHVLRARSAGIDPATEPDALAALLTSWALEVSGDRHLEVRHSPAEYEAAVLGNADQFAIERQRRAQRNNFGVARIERLPANVGLVELTSFFEPALSGDVIAAAMRVIVGTEALIIDLRRNRGGHPATVAMVLSYVFDSDQDPVHLNDIYFHEADRLQQFWTLPYLPGPRFGSTKPIYVLTSSESFSAAEEFAYDL